MKSRAWLLLAVLAPGLAGCAAVARVGVHFLYRKAELPAAQVVRDVCYMPGPNCDSNAHRLDLYPPGARDWPRVGFMCGGGWHGGKKSLGGGGAEVYANIGRYFGSQGIGAVVINY